MHLVLTTTSTSRADRGTSDMDGGSGGSGGNGGNGGSGGSGDDGRDDQRRGALLKELVRAIPKVELHVHLEGTLEPEMVFALARRNNIDLSPYFKDEEDLRSRYDGFTGLSSFLKVYFQCASVLCTERDFYDLTMAYLERARQDNVVYAECFFDPQLHKQNNGFSFEMCADGILAAFRDAKSRYGIKAKLLPCFLRHMSEESAMAMWTEIFKYLQSHPEAKSQIIGVGLDSSEKKHPPRKFHGVFWMVRHASKAVVGDMHIVAHAGEEGPTSYIGEALNLLQAERIDHGISCSQDMKLVRRLVDEQIPLTVCPLSNIRLKVFDQMKSHNLKQLLDLGLNVSLHSDDPAYFGYNSYSGYLDGNYFAAIDALGMDEHDILKLATNAIRSSFLTEGEKDSLYQRLFDVSRPILDKLAEDPNSK